MNMKIDELRSTLNDLIETCKDGEQGFRTAAEKLQDTSIRAQFRTFGQQRAHFAGELQAEVTRLGDEPATSGSTSGAIHRGWIGLKSALTGDSDQAILDEAERGEDIAVKSYRDALSKHLPGDLEEIVDRQYRDVVQVHNMVRSMRETAKTMSGRR